LSCLLLTKTKLQVEFASDYVGELAYYVLV